MNTVPPYHTLMLPLLKVMGTRNEMTTKQMRDEVSENLGLSVEAENCGIVDFSQYRGSSPGRRCNPETCDPLKDLFDWHNPSSQHRHEHW